MDYDIIKFGLSKVLQNNCTPNTSPLPRGGINTCNLTRANKDTLYTRANKDTGFSLNILGHDRRK